MARHSAHRGFTLLELVLVMMIICTCLALASPMLSGFWKGRASDDATQQIVALCHWARDRAIIEGKVYRLNIDTKENSYFLTMQDTDDFVELGTEFGRTFKLGEDFRLQLVRTNDEQTRNTTSSNSDPADANAPANLDYINFRPDGSADSTILHLTDPQGQETYIGSRSPTELYRVLKPEEVPL